MDFHWSSNREISTHLTVVSYICHSDKAVRITGDWCSHLDRRKHVNYSDSFIIIVICHCIEEVAETAQSDKGTDSTEGSKEPTPHATPTKV